VPVSTGCASSGQIAATSRSRTARGFLSIFASAGIAVFSGAAATSAAAFAGADVLVFVDQISVADSNPNAADRTGGVASSAALSEAAPSCATDGSFPFMFATILTPSESDDAMLASASPEQDRSSRELSSVFARGCVDQATRIAAIDIAATHDCLFGVSARSC
jgi:hypothetical protein